MKCDRRLLESVSGSTKCDSYEKVRRNKTTPSVFLLTCQSHLIPYNTFKKAQSPWKVMSVNQTKCFERKDIKVLFDSE